MMACSGQDNLAPQPSWHCKPLRIYCQCTSVFISTINTFHFHLVVDQSMDLSFKKNGWDWTVNHFQGLISSTGQMQNLLKMNSAVDWSCLSFSSVFCALIIAFDELVEIAVLCDLRVCVPVHCCLSKTVTLFENCLIVDLLTSLMIHERVCINI